MLDKIEALKTFILDRKSNTQNTKKTKIKTYTKNFQSRKSVINNVLKLYNKITIIINAFVNRFIYSGDVKEDVHYSTKRLEPELKESRAKRTKLRRQKN